MPIHTVYTLSQDDPESRNWLAFLRRHGCTGLNQLTIERVYWLEGDVDVQKLLSLLVNPLYQIASNHSHLDPARGPVIEIAYRPAVTDPETPSILEAAHALGETGLEFARLSRRYQFSGLEESEAKKIASRFLFNKIVERIRSSDEIVHTLRPSGEPDPANVISLRGLGDCELEKLSTERSWYAPLSQMKAIQTHELRQGRPHTDAEIEILVQSWSDHCYHTTWKSLGLLKRLSTATAKIQHPLVVSAFKDNAGGMRFYEDCVITIKGETHNFPSSIAPFGGVATKHGGVIRDTLGFGKGAYPIGGTTVMGTMDPRMADENVPEGALHPQLILAESIRATAYYVNPMGIPMMHPVYRCHPGYAKCLALGHSIGLIPEKYALKDAPQPGDIAVLIGGETGRDGIHGATASSTGMTGATLEKEFAAVQIGHPITERRFASAIPVLRDAGCIRAITDLGAGGLSSAAGEIGAETGVTLDLDRIPLKDASLTAWEILLSESQERMLLVIPTGKMDETLEILDRYEVAHSIIGEFTSSGRLQASWRGEQVVDLEMDFLWKGCPIDAQPLREPQRAPQSLAIAEPRSGPEWSRAIENVLAHYHCADQSAAGSRFDTTVQGRTAVGPYGGRNHRMPSNIYVSAPLRGKSYGVVTIVAFNPLYGEVNPGLMARLMMMEAITKLVAAGVDYREAVLCDNFYTPRVTPEVAWDLSQMVDAIAELSIELGTPFISGKDSSSGTFETAGRKIDVPMTLAVAAMGRLPDVRKIVTKEFKRAGNKLVLVGPVDAEALGGSVYADTQQQRGDRLFDPGDSKSIRAVWDSVLELHAAGGYCSASAIAEGGLLLRLFEAAFGSELGARVDLGAIGPGRRDGLLFGEFIGTMLLEVTLEDETRISRLAVPYCVVGEVLAEPRLVLEENGSAIWQEEIKALSPVWSSTFQGVLE